MSTAIGTTKIWMVYLPNGEEIRVIAEWVDVDDLGESVRFMNGWPKDAAWTIAQFFTNNICGYLQVGVIDKP